MRGGSLMDVQGLQSMDAQGRAAAVYIGHLRLYLIISFRIADMSKSIIASPSGIQNGLNTHHQDQLITLHNLRIMKTNSNTSRKLIPPFATVLVFLSYSLYISYSNFVIYLPLLYKLIIIHCDVYK